MQFAFGAAQTSKACLIVHLLVVAAAAKWFGQAVLPSCKLLLIERFVPLLKRLCWKGWEMQAVVTFGL